jgi:hypothetical protein
MAGLWLRDDKLAKKSSIEVGASASEVVTEEFKLTPGAANNAMRVDVVASSVTASTGITAKLQQKVAGTYSDVATVSVTGNGTFSILLNGRDTGASYFSLLPLSNLARVLLTTGAGDTATIDNVYVTMED